MLRTKISCKKKKKGQILHFIWIKKINTRESPQLLTFCLSFINYYSVASQMSCALVNIKYRYRFWSLSLKYLSLRAVTENIFLQPNLQNIFVKNNQKMCLRHKPVIFLSNFKAPKCGLRPKFIFCPLKISCEHTVLLVLGLFLGFLHDKLYPKAHVT